MTMTDEERFARKLAKQKAKGEKIYALVLALCELEGGRAMKQRTAERAEVWKWVSDNKRRLGLA
jgi:hypothetical protein